MHFRMGNLRCWIIFMEVIREYDESSSSKWKRRGRGKTFTAVNLAAAAEKSVYIDCDVEEPNGHLF